MSRAFSTDFSSVRVHEASRVRALGALGYTRGNDIYFAPGEYQPTSQRGLELLGHELAHVVQQRQGRVATDPQAQGDAINADPALEREADEMGARAARGESVGAVGSAGQHASGPSVIQCFSVTMREGKQWRISERGGVATDATGGAGSRSKQTYATPALIAESNTKLSAAGSFIRLEPGMSRFGRAQVLPRFVGPRAEHGEVLGEQGSTRGTSMVLPSDCNNSARVIMGIDHQPTSTSQQPTDPEVTVAEMGPGHETLDQRREFNVLKAGGGKSNLVESGGLTQLTNSMVRYRAEIANRPVLAADPAGVAFFQKRTETLTERTTEASAWGVLYALKQQHPAVYRDFSSWSGSNEFARPEVGDALVTYRPEGKDAEAFATNPRAYQVMLEALRNAITDGGRRGKMIESLRAVLDQTTRELEKIDAGVLERRKTLEDAQSNLERDRQELKRQESVTYKDEAAAHEALHPIKTQVREHEIKIVGIERQLKEVDNRRKPPLALQHVTRSLLDKLSDVRIKPDELAREALAMIGVAPDTTWSEVRVAINQDMRAKRYGEDVDSDMLNAVDKNDLWNKHWGGVVMTEGSDYLTLENDASTARHGKMNSEWGFALYGSEQPGQSFHDQMMQTGDFGNFASTARFTGPESSHDKQRRGAQDDRNLPRLFAPQEVDLAISRAGSDDNRLRAVLEQMPLNARAAVKRRYAVDAPLPEQIRRRVIELIDELAGMKTPRIALGGCRSEALRLDGGPHDPPPPGEAF